MVGVQSQEDPSLWLGGVPVRSYCVPTVFSPRPAHLCSWEAMLGSRGLSQHIKYVLDYKCKTSQGRSLLRFSR